LITKKRIFLKKQEMPILLQWMCSEDSGMRTLPTGVKALSSETMEDQVGALYDALRTSPRKWCDDTMILMLNDQRTITQHLLVVTEVERIPSPGEQIHATVKAFLSMGHADGGDPSRLTIHAACGETPAFFDQVVRLLVSGRILAGLGVKSVSADIFTPEIGVYTKYGFVVTDQTSTNASVLLQQGGSRKSRSVRSKRFRKTRRHTNKQ
jgi:hypothetical protein